MDFSKMSNGMKIGIGSGVVLLIVSLLPWYGVSSFGFSVSTNGWGSGFTAWFGIVLGLAATAALGAKVFAGNDFSLGVLKTEQIALLLGALSTIFVVLRFITESSFTKFGLYLGILAAAGITYGAFMAMKEAGLDMPSTDDFKSFGSGGDEPPPPPPA